MTPNDMNHILEFTAQLDYSIESTDDRLTALKNILEVYDENTNKAFPAAFFEDYFTNYFNPNITQDMPLSDKILVCIGLQYMAGYLLFNKEENNKDIIKEKTQKYRNTKHVSLQKLLEEQGEDTLPQTPPPARHKQIRPTITEEDRENIPPLADMHKFISSLALQMEKEEDSKEKYRLKKILIEARQDQYAIKDCYFPTISFMSPDLPSTKYDFDEDTRYKRDDKLYQMVSRNTIDLSDPKHVYQLLNHYSALRQQHYDQPHNDMRYILDTLDYFIEKTDLKGAFRAILLRRVDGATYERIAEEILNEYGIDLSVPYLSSTFVNHIPKQIARVYQESYEEWEKVRAGNVDYKICTSCKEKKLRVAKYFRRDSKSPDGLSTKCKECRKKEDKRRSAKENNSRSIR